MVCCLTLERPGWWSRAARWLEAAREELVWRLEPEPAVVIPMSADRAREELNRRAEELLDASHPDFNPQVDPKCSWALRHLDFFPVEVNRADYEALLRIPGVGVVSAKRILVSRRARKLRIEDLPKLGVVMKRAQYFLTASGRMADGLRFTPDSLLRNLIAAERPSLPQPELEQMSLFDTVKDDDILKELKELDISNLTPLDALNTLNRLQSKLRNRW